MSSNQNNSPFEVSSSKSNLPKGNQAMSDQSICFAVTAGIAIYKSLDVISTLRKKGFTIHVMMTPHAAQMIAPITFATISGNPVMIHPFEETMAMPHIELVEQAGTFVICPATYNIIGKIASGIADDLVSTSAAVAYHRRVIAPAMNVHMFENPILNRNLRMLSELGWEIIPPQYGMLACGYEGLGKLASVDQIVDILSFQHSTSQPLKDVPILVTAGATQEDIDPVRFITNRSSGKMGMAICRAAKQMGAKVTLIHGNVDTSIPLGVHAIYARSAVEMLQRCHQVIDQQKVLIMAAAVSDYRMDKVEAQKIKKDDRFLTLVLVQNPDILKELYPKKHDRIFVGFAAETEHLEEYAQKKMHEKHLDMIVANSVSEEGSGFDVDTNRVTFLFPNRPNVALPILTKDEVARNILEQVAHTLKD